MKKRPLIFGEVLIDEFPDGRQLLGGAPFNVACHLKAFGEDPLFVSRVGDDHHGSMIRRRIRDLGLDPSGTEIDNSHPTGRVRVDFACTSPRFHIFAEQAYDYIEARALIPVLHHLRLSLVYAGTLATRGEVSRGTLRKLLVRSGLPLFIDLNLRPPWTDLETIISQVETASWVKVNEAELAYLSGQSSIPINRIATEGKNLLSTFDLRMLIVTCGSRGAFLITPERALFEAPPPIPAVVDSVGAGDAFSAVSIEGLLRGKSPAEILRKAVTLSGMVCTFRGAIPLDSDFYASFKRDYPELDWGDG